jgi:hypothetical protein
VNVVRVWERNLPVKQPAAGFWLQRAQKKRKWIICALRRWVNGPLFCGNRGANGKRLNRHEGTVLEAFLKYHLAVDQGEQGVVFAHPYVNARVVLGAALAHEDVTRSGSLPTENFYA